MKSLEKIKKEAIEEHVPIIMDDTLEKIEEIVGDRKFKRILEIGTAVGYSALCFTKFLDENGEIDTIERNDEMVRKAKENIKLARHDVKINLFEGDAVEILKTLNNKYDMVFIDAAKSKYPIFLEESLRMLNDDGIIFADNILYKGYVMSDYNKHKQRTAVTHLREFIKMITTNDKLETQIIDVGDGLSYTKYVKWKVKWNFEKQRIYKI